MTDTQLFLFCVSTKLFNGFKQDIFADLDLIVMQKFQNLFIPSNYDEKMDLLRFDTVLSS